MENYEENYKVQKACTYKGERYYVRDNGAIFRCARQSGRKRPKDQIWTFGKQNDKGYMMFGTEFVHRIVATAFLGNPKNDDCVVDHKDTIRFNNRPENLRWVTRLENLFFNPITYNRICILCDGDIEKILKDPSILRKLATDSSWDWVKAVKSAELREAYGSYRRSLHNRMEKTKSEVARNRIEVPFSKEEWLSGRYKEVQVPYRTDVVLPQKALYPDNAMQVKWKTRTEFVCCPTMSEDDPLNQYLVNLVPGSLFSKNQYTEQYVVKASLTKDHKALMVMTKSGEKDPVKPFALCKIFFLDGNYIHENCRSFFKEDGALKYFTIGIGEEWDGGTTFDDDCM